MGNITSQSLIELAEQVGAALVRNNLTIVTAESCTGGGIMQTLTEVAGSSDWCEGGFVTYSNRAKHSFIGVPEQTIQQYGAVSAETVEAMAAGALVRSDATLSVAVSGVAGPGGGSADKPVGTVWIAWGMKGGTISSRCFLFAGDRSAVRRQSVYQALSHVLDLCGEKVQR